MHEVKNAIESIAEGRAPDSVIVELFDRLLPMVGSTAFANAAVNRYKMPIPAQDYPDSPHFQQHHPRNYMRATERAYLDLMNDAFMMLSRAHLAANAQLKPFGLRYEISSEKPLSNLYHLSETVPEMINVAIQLRDVVMPRRLPQVVRYRISVGRKKNRVSLSILDPKLSVFPRKAIFKLNPLHQEFEIRNFEDKLVPALIQRAKKAFKRSESPE